MTLLIETYLLSVCVCVLMLTVLFEILTTVVFITNNYIVDNSIGVYTFITIFIAGCSNNNCCPTNIVKLNQQ